MAVKLYYHYEKEVIDDITYNYVLYSNQPFYSTTFPGVSPEYPSGLTDPWDAPGIYRIPMLVTDGIYKFIPEGEYLYLPEDAKYVFAYTKGNFTQQASRQDQLNLTYTLDAEGMFYGSEISDFTTSATPGFNSILNCRAMFKDCSALYSVRLNSSDKCWVQNMSQMFMNCTNLQYLTIGDAYKTVGSLNDISYMLYNCSSLQKINFNIFTKAVTDFSSTFENCKSVKTIDLYKCDLSSAENLSSMFRGCDELTYILFNGNIPGSVNNCSYTFSNCPKLKWICAPRNTDWNMASPLDSTGMFEGSPSLPDYDSTKIDIMCANNIKNDQNQSYFVYNYVLPCAIYIKFGNYWYGGYSATLKENDSWTDYELWHYKELVK